jgi:hypothetical protein
MPGCNERQLDEARNRLGVELPTVLREMYRANDGRFRSDGEWWVVWPLDRLVDDNLRAWRDGSLERSLIAFGDDGTGDPFCLRVNGQSDLVVHWSFIDAAVAGEMTLVDFHLEWLALERRAACGARTICAHGGRCFGSDDRAFGVPSSSGPGAAPGRPIRRSGASGPVDGGGLPERNPPGIVADLAHIQEQAGSASWPRGGAESATFCAGRSTVGEHRFEVDGQPFAALG